MKKKNHNHSPQKTRSGVLVVEAIVGAVVLGVAIAILVPAMSAVKRQRQTHRFEAIALVELNNIDEQLASVIEPDNLPKLSPWFQQRYSTSRLEAELLPVADDENGKRLQGLRLTILKPAQKSVPDHKVSIVVWRLQKEATP